MDGDPSISDKKTVEENLVEASVIWGGEVIQYGLNIYNHRHEFFYQIL